MAQHKVTVYRARLERVTLTVQASSKYDADQKAFTVADNPNLQWETLPLGTDWPCGETSYDPEPFTTEDPPRLWGKGGNSTELS